MNADDYIRSNYYLEGAVGPDKELWPNNDNIVANGNKYNLNGYFDRVRKINSSLRPIGEEIVGLRSDLVKRKAELEVAKSAYNAAVSGIEETRENFKALVNLYPEEISDENISSIAVTGAT
jgi:hypothetical protein